MEEKLNYPTKEGTVVPYEIRSIDEISMIEAVEFVAKDGLLRNFSDGSFREDLKVTLGVFAKLIFLLEKRVSGIEEPSDNSKGVFNRYIASMIKYLGEGNKLLCSYFETREASDYITQNEAYVWMKVVYEKDYKMEFNSCENYVHANRNEYATRGWLAQLLYFFSQYFVRKIEDECGGEREKFSCDWWKDFYREEYGLIPYCIIEQHRNDNLGVSARAIRFVIERKFFPTDQVIEHHLLLNSMAGIGVKLRELYDELVPEPVPAGTDFTPLLAYHYTSLKALKSILAGSIQAFQTDPSKGEDLSTCWKDGIKQMRMSNAEFLNDPDEGMLLLDMYSKIKQRDGKCPDEPDSDEIFLRNQYVISLNLAAEELLPMWSLYGDRGEGCRIEFEVLNRTNFQKICYLDEKKRDEVKKYLKEVSKEYEKYIRDKENSRKLQEWISFLLSIYGYYYKDQAYSYEQEIRLIKWCPVTNIHCDEEKQPTEAFSNLYSYIDTPLAIKSIMLGPKCKNPKRVAAILKYYYKIPEVKMSKIHFQ